MRLGIITDEVSQDFEVAARLAAEYGLQGLELRSVWEKGPHELSDSDIADIAKIARQYGLAICGISAPVFKCDLDNAGEVAEHYEILGRCAALAQKTGATMVRGFSFWAKDPFEQRLAEIAGHVRAAGEKLGAVGLTYALEFDPSVYARTGAMALRVMEAADSPHVKLLWDPGNDIFVDGERPYPDGYELVKPYIAHVHIKDAHRHADGSTTAEPVGQGDVDYVGQLAALQRDRYAGWVVLETHYRVKENLDQALLDMPKGSSFSLGGYEASRICLDGLLKLLGRQKP